LEAPPRKAVGILLLAASGMSDNKQREIIPALELKCPKKSTQSIVEFRPPPEVRTRFLKVFITQYQQPVNQKRQKIQIQYISQARFSPSHCVPVGICNSCSYRSIR
jgi:hypothetical protein